MELETSIRLVKKTQEMQGQPVSKGRISTTTTTTKTKKVKQQKSLRDILIASGITDEAILASMLAAAGVKG
jgi:D-serine deaminase-like pyridoxal phosphate-dependent protein